MEKEAQKSKNDKEGMVGNHEDWLKSVGISYSKFLNNF